MSQTFPGQSAVAITPNDSTDLARVTRGLYVGVSGDLKVDMADGSTVAFVGLVGGVVHPLAVKRVYATGQAGSIATGIIGLY